MNNDNLLFANGETPKWTIPCYKLDEEMESMFPEMREIEGFEGYFITKNGEVYSNKKYNELHKMVLKEDKDGYLEVGLYKNKKRYFRRVHRLVGITFLENKNHLPQINHKDGNKKNNSIENLEWCTCSNNLLHSFRELKRKPSITTNKRLILENKTTQEELFFNSIKDCAYYLSMSSEHLGRLISGSRDISKSRKLSNYNIKLI